MAKYNGTVVTVSGVTYPTKAIASFALHELGAGSFAEIAEMIGSTPMAVRKAIQLAKRNAAKPELTPNIWTPEKAAKVRRLFGMTMIEIATAVAVPPAELLKYVLHGVVPPSHRVASPTDIEWRRDRAQTAVAAPKPNQAQLAAPKGILDSATILPREAFEAPDTDPDVADGDALLSPDRDDDEAELASLAAQKSEVEETKPAEVAPPAPVRFQPPIVASEARVAEPAVAPRRSATTGMFPGGKIVRLVDDKGRYLHESLDGFTKELKWAWDGDRAHFDAVKARMPKVVAKLMFEVVS